MPAQHQVGLGHPDRRSFLRASGTTAAMAFAGTGALTSLAYADALTQAQREKLSPDDVLALLKKGNRRFYTGKREDHNWRDSCSSSHSCAGRLMKQMFRKPCPRRRANGASTRAVRSGKSESRRLV
jgi:hypothetical protein